MSAANGLIIRGPEKDDLPRLAEIAAERDGGGVEKQRSRLTRLLLDADPDRMIALVAEYEEGAVAYALARLFRPEEIGDSGAASPADPDSLAPRGWYLLGIVVAPEYRRRGIGAALTRERLARIATRDSSAYYFSNENNPVSIALHAEFRFEKLTRVFQFPGVSFEGGQGILFHVDLREHPLSANRNSS